MRLAGSSSVCWKTSTGLLMEEETCGHPCFLDVSKALERVDGQLRSVNWGMSGDFYQRRYQRHGLQLDKLACVGINQTELQWFLSYVVSWKISSCIDRIQPSESFSSSGVTQGSVLQLEPLLFILYMSELPDVVSGSSAVLLCRWHPCIRSVPYGNQLEYPPLPPRKTWTAFQSELSIE